MYKEHFRLRAMPFLITPDPGYFYLSTPHRDALLLLRHALQHGGIAVLTGEVGAGKTTVCRRLLDELPTATAVAQVHNPRLAPHELLQALCRALQLDPGEAGNTAALAARIAAAHDAGSPPLLLIDEAQALSAEVLDQLRLLADACPALRIMLVGQPELAALLAEPRNARFNERVAMRHHLGPLARGDVAGYVQHRLGVAGGSASLLPRRLMPRLHRMSQGLPRVINLICDRALLGACVLGKGAVTPRILSQARAEALGDDSRWPRWWQALWGARLAPAAFGALAMLASGVGGALAMRAADVSAAAARPPATGTAEAGDPSDWPATLADTPDGGEALAHAALLGRWRTAPAPGRPCAGTLPGGLRCVQGRDGLDDLRRLNTPAVLQLRDGQGRKRHVALVQLQGGQAVLQLGDTVRRVPVAALQAQWTRQYTLMWRPPAGLAGPLEAGTRGPAVDWLRERLGAWRGTPAASLPRALEGALKTQLQAFQAAEGLSATGGGDLRTLVHLATRTEPGAPVLEAHHCDR